MGLPCLERGRLHQKKSRKRTLNTLGPHGRGCEWVIEAGGGGVVVVVFILVVGPVFIAGDAKFIEAGIVLEVGIGIAPAMEECKIS